MRARFTQMRNAGHTHAHAAQQNSRGVCRLGGERRMQQRTIFGRHYALAVVAVIFVALLAAAGLRSTPGVLMVPWDRKRRLACAGAL